MASDAEREQAIFHELRRGPTSAYILRLTVGGSEVEILAALDRMIAVGDVEEIVGSTTRYARVWSRKTTAA